MKYLFTILALLGFAIHSSSVLAEDDFDLKEVRCSYQDLSSIESGISPYQDPQFSLSVDAKEMVALFSLNSDVLPSVAYIAKINPRQFSSRVLPMQIQVGDFLLPVNGKKRAFSKKRSLKKINIETYHVIFKDHPELENAVIQVPTEKKVLAHNNAFNADYLVRAKMKLKKGPFLSMFGSCRKY